MASSKTRNKISQSKNKSNQQMQNRISMHESADNVIESRSGWRGTGWYQKWRYDAGEGVFTFGLGGPSQVGK